MNLNLFNRDWYLSNNPDIAAAAAAGLIDPEQHFIQFGMAEGRSPHPLFDAEFYLQANPDVAEAVQSGQISAVQHFLNNGMAEGRSSHPLFDADYYLQANPDVAAAVASGSFSAAEHFFLFGMNEPRAINPVIHLGEYLASNPDVAQAAQNGQIDALTHLLNHGVREGRELGNGISAQLFTQDPVFANALEQGNVGTALQRVTEVAPFLPTFRAPEGWAPPATTPIPLDFPPPAGVQLVVPASVKVPENVTLPPQFSAPGVNPPGQPSQPTAPGNSGGSGNSGSPSDDGSGNTDTPDVQTPPAATQLFTPKTGTTAGSSDASTAIVLDANYMVVGDDEANVLRVYDRKGGKALVEWSFESSTKGAFGNDELDLEAGTRIGNTLYFIGSHSNKKSGAEADSREFLFSVNVNGTGAGTTFEMGSVRDGLETLLVNWDSSNAHGKGANYFGFAVSAGSGVIPEAVNGFSIEGMTVSRDGNELLLGFRAPQTDAGTRDKAVIVPLALNGLFDATPTIGTPIELDLGGRGIRAIEKAADGSGYLILAGPAMSASPDVTHDFRLFTWDGTQLNGSATPHELDVSLDTLRDVTGGSFETLVEVPNLLPGTRIQLLQDNGDTVWEGQTKVSKDLDPANQKFMGNWITLGNPVTSTGAPELLRTSPAEGSDKAFKAANIELVFDRGVQRGTEGTITLKAESQTDRIIPINDATQVSFNFNTVVINPAEDLMTGTAYTVEITANAIKGWSGLTEESALQFSTATPPDSYSLIISEVNSNATGGDFFELYNHGTTDINLSGWKWTDSAAAFSSAEGIFPAGTVIAAGKSLVVAASESLTSFLNAWSLPQITHPVVATGGPGLGGSGDAVIVFNSLGSTVTAFNYGSSPLTASDGTVIAPLPGGGDKHAGQIVTDGGAKVSAVWDGVSTETPNYVTVDTTKAGAIIQKNDASSIGTPGVVFAEQALPRYNLLITEVNSNGNGGDFVELYNYGNESINLSGWKFTDSAWESKETPEIATLAEGTVLEAGKTLVLLVDGATTDKVSEFAIAWGLFGDTSNVMPAGTNAPGLSKADGVVILDASGKTAAAFNYGTTTFTAPDGTIISPLPGGGGHAGAAVGGGEKASAIWDGVSTANPTYVAASVELGSVAQSSPNAATIGSPGVAKPVVPPVNYDLLITEVNSAPGKGDEFFELYNHGSSDINLSGWKWTDDTGSKVMTFAEGTTIGAGKVLLVINGTDTAGFLTTWGLNAETTKFINFTNGPGLGSGDAVVIFDNLNNTAASFNYGTQFTSTVNNSLIPSSFNLADSTTDNHAGMVAGGADSVSAVWNGASLTDPVYVAAVAGQLGAIALTGSPTTIGSPGSVSLID